MNTQESVFIVPCLAGQSMTDMKAAGRVIPSIKQYTTRVENVCI